MWFKMVGKVVITNFWWFKVIGHLFKKSTRMGHIRSLIKHLIYIYIYLSNICNSHNFNLNDYYYGLEQACYSYGGATVPFYDTLGADTVFRWKILKNEMMVDEIVYIDDYIYYHHTISSS